MMTKTTLGNLIFGGFAALGFWEVWANWPTQLVAGYQLEPPALIVTLFHARLGVELPLVWAKGLHYLTGFLFYPIGYWLLIRSVSLNHALAGWAWGVVTYFIALGVFAPLAGLPFLLIGDNATLSFMSLIGHAGYGYVLSVVFGALESQRPSIQPVPAHA
jgi:hypothetical protein